MLFRSDPYHSPVWRGLRTLILSSFLLISGLSFGLAQVSGRDFSSLKNRWLQIAGCAFAVTAGSYLMFPNSPILFGVLHAVCAMWLIAYFIMGMLSSAYLISLIGIVMILAGTALKFDALSQPWLSWLGMVSRKPRTEDYVPLLPWIGVFMLGLAASKTRALEWALHQPLQHRALSWLGKRSLTVYMVHQPIFIGLLWLLVTAFKAT